MGWISLHKSENRFCLHKPQILLSFHLHHLLICGRGFPFNMTSSTSFIWMVLVFLLMCIHLHPHMPWYFLWMDFHLCLSIFRSSHLSLSPPPTSPLFILWNEVLQVHNKGYYYPEGVQIVSILGNFVTRWFSLNFLFWENRIFHPHNIF